MKIINQQTNKNPYGRQRGREGSPGDGIREIWRNGGRVTVGFLSPL